MTKHLSCVLAALLLVGCFPAVVTYYEPSARSGSVINDACGAAAPASTLKLQVKATDLRVTGGEHSFTVTLRVPKGSTVRMASTDVAVTVGGEAKHYALGEFSYYDREKRQSVKVAAGETLGGADEHFVFGNEPRIFQTSLQWEGASDIYQVHLPAIVVDGNVIEIPTITFTKKSGVGVYPVNC